MPTQPSTLRQLILSGLLLFIAMLPFFFYLKRDFANFQRTSPTAALTEKVPFSPERILAIAIGLSGAFVGITRFPFLLDTFPPLAGPSWRRLLIGILHIAALLLCGYLLSPTGYFVWQD